MGLVRLALFVAVAAYAQSAALGQDLSGQPRARQILKSARELYAKGDYEAADQLYDQANQAKEGLTATEQQDLATQIEQNATALKARRDGLDLMRKAQDALIHGKGAEAEAHIRLAQANQFLAPSDKQQLASIAQGLVQLRQAQADLDGGKSDAKSLLLRGREALKRGDYDSAETLARQAEKARSMMASLAFWGDSPARLLDDVRTARQRAPKTPDAVKKDDGSVVVANYSPADLAKAKVQARQYILDGYKALEANDVAGAQKLAQQAQALRVPLDAWEPNPDKLLAEIQKRATTAQVVASGDPRATLKHARTLFQQQRYDEAEKFAVQAESAPGARWNLFEDSPRKLREEIVRARTQLDTKQAPSTSVSIAPPPPDIATVIGPKTGAPTEVVNPQAKLRAMAMLAEARQLERQGHLTEARAKALEADKTFNAFGPSEESPAIVLNDLGARAAARVKQLLDQANDVVLRTPTDPTRFQKADNYLLTARRLAEAFRQDTGPIDQKIQWLVQMATQNSGSLASNVVLQSAAEMRRSRTGDEPSEAPANDPALLKLEAARRELNAGNTVLARKLAEDVFLNPVFREEAKKVLRTIDSEEHGRTLLSAKNTFDAGMDAFLAKDYRRAVTLLGSLDARLLTPDQAKRVGEVMESPELARGLAGATGRTPPSPIQQVAGTTPPIPAPLPSGAETKAPGKASASDVEDPLFSKVREMRQIQYEKFRGERLAAERKAMDLEKAGNPDQAVSALQEYLVSVQSAGLDSDVVSKLSASVDSKIQKLRDTMAKRDAEKQKQAAQGYVHDEDAMVAAKAKTQQQVAELIRRGGQYYKEGKFDQSLAEGRKAQELDPTNLAAQSLIQVSATKREAKTWDDNKAKAEAQFLEMLRNDPGEFVTSNEPVKVNSNVLAKAIANRTDKTTQIYLNKSPKEMAIERKLLLPIPLNFTDVPLYRVLQDLQVISGVNIVADKAALADKNISLEQPVTLNVDSISLKSALNLIVKQAKLNWVIRHEVIEVTTPENTQGKRRMHTYAIGDLVTPVVDKGTSEVNSFEEALKRHINNGAGAVKYNAPTPQLPPNALSHGTPVSQGGGQNAPAWHGQGASHTLENVLISTITNIVAPESWEQSGGEGRIQYFPLGHALVVSQSVEVQEEVAALLNQLRKLQDIQISIEMRVVSVSESFFEKIGLDFDVNLRTPHFRSENQLLTGNYAPFNQVNRNLGVNGVLTGLTPAGQLTPDLNVPIKSSSFDFSVPPFGGFPGTLGADGGLSLGLAFLSDIQVFMFLEAAQGDRRTHIMQAPKITVFNGQTANINVQDVMFFLTGVAVVQAGSQTFFVPQNNPFPIGVGMQVTPVVSADRRFVRVNLQPQLSNLISPNIPLIPVQIPIPQLFDGPNGQGVIAGQPVIFQMFFQQPAFTTININTTVNVPDGGTVLLGGMKTLAEGRNEFGPPILSKIPYLSRLFRNTAFGRDAQSIMILVTPRIIINEEIEREILGELTIPR